MAGKPTGQLQFEQRQLYGRRRQAGLPDQIIDRHRCKAEQIENRPAVRSILAAFVTHKLAVLGVAQSITCIRSLRTIIEMADQFQYIIGGLDQRRTFADQQVASPGSRAVISDPERGAASTTTVPRASPAMIRLR